MKKYLSKFFALLLCFCFLADISIAEASVNSYYHSSDRALIDSYVKCGFFTDYKYDFYDADPNYTYSYDYKDLCQKFVWDPETASHTDDSGIRIGVEEGISVTKGTTVSLCQQWGGSVNLAGQAGFSGTRGFTFTKSFTISKSQAQNYSTVVRKGMPYGTYYFAAVAYYDAYEVEKYKYRSNKDGLESETYFEYMYDECFIKFIRQDLP